MLTSSDFFFIDSGKFFISLFTLFISFLLSCTLIPFVIRFGESYGILDYPEPNKQISIPKVRVGGLAIFFSFFITSIFVFILFFNLDLKLSLIFFLLIPLIFFLGLFDDIFKLSPFTRLLIQFLLSFLVCFFGLIIDINHIDFLGFLSANIFISRLISYLITIIWITGIINAFNWLDGLDGLAAGFSTISSFILALISIQVNNPIGLVLSSIIFGSSIGFLIYNSYPSKILMGDCGSNFLGFSLAILAIVVFKTDNHFHIQRMFILFIVPILDMLFVILLRIKSSKSPLVGDRTHLHYRILNRVVNYRRTILIMYCLFFFSGVFCLTYIT